MNPPRVIYEFGRFRLDPEAHLLLCGDEIIALEPKAVDVLMILVEKRGELVARQELMTAVWPDTFVEDNNLSSNISILRKQLGMTGDGGDYIQTIPKRGYRFIAAVKQVETLPPAIPSGPVVSSDPVAPSGQEVSSEVTPAEARGPEAARRGVRPARLV